jgi:hypothetical protein
MSPNRVVRTPSEPEAPPTTPAAVAVAPLSPFTLEVTWRFGDVNAYGFEVQRSDETGEFRRVGVAEPDARRFVDHGRRPSTTSTYRVRAFNPRGVSAWSVTASGATRVLAELSPPPRSATEAKCTTLDAETSRIADEGAIDGVPARTRVCRDILLDGGHHVDAVTVPAFCGAQNCAWTLYGDVGGCYRALGSFTLVSPECPRFETIAVADDGWPVLRAYAHESAMGSRVAVHVFLRGEYVDVDGYVECSSKAPVAWGTDREAPQEDPARWAPPFTGCWKQ